MSALQRFADQSQTSRKAREWPNPEMVDASRGKEKATRRRHAGLNQGLRSLNYFAFRAAFLAPDICRKDCSEAAGRSHVISPAARRTPSMRSALSSGRVHGI